MCAAAIQFCFPSKCWPSGRAELWVAQKTRKRGRREDRGSESKVKNDVYIGERDCVCERE